jgi:hypothetical protein
MNKSFMILMEEFVLSHLFLNIQVNVKQVILLMIALLRAFS